jgi:NAD-dependent SIR2 family protein deacetylase
MARIIKLETSKSKQEKLLALNASTHKFMTSLNDMKQVLLLIEQNIDKNNNHAKENISSRR